MERENSSGVIKVSMMETSIRTIFTVKVSMFGPMEEYILVNGSIIRWKEQELSHGVTEEDTLVSIRMIKSMVMVHSIGQMAGNISVNGAKESSTEKELILRKERRDLVSGKWVRESNGLKTLMELLKNDLIYK